MDKYSEKAYLKYLRKKEKKKNEYLSDYEKSERNKKYSYFDKLFMRIFFSSLILLSFFVVPKIKQFENFTSIVNSNLNFISFSNIFSGIFGNIFEFDDDYVYSSDIYESVKYQDGVNIVKHRSFDGVKILVPGVVTKIYKDENGLYNLTILGVDDYIYTYIGLETKDVRIYEYLREEAILGKSRFTTDSYEFTVIIEKDNQRVSFYDNVND